MEDTNRKQSGTVVRFSQVSQEVEAQRAEVQTKRPRKATTLKLEWYAERMRKIERIKDAVNCGTYHIDSIKVARALIDPV